MRLEPGCNHWISTYAFFNTTLWQHHEVLPRCPVHKATVLKPDVVLFGQRVAKRNLDRAVAMLKDPEARVVVVIGTAADVAPTADLPWIARQRGMEIYDINPLVSHLTLKGLTSGYVLGNAEEILPKILAIREDLAPSHFYNWSTRVC